MELDDAHTRLANAVREVFVALLEARHLAARLRKLPAVGRSADDIKAAVTLRPQVAHVHEEIRGAAGAPIQGDAFEAQCAPRYTPALVLPTAEFQESHAPPLSSAADFSHPPIHNAPPIKPPSALAEAVAEKDNDALEDAFSLGLRAAAPTA